MRPYLSAIRRRFKRRQSRIMAAITIEDFTAFFEAKKKAIYKCPFCDSPHFNIAQTWQETPAEGQVWFVPGPGIVQHGYHSYYAILCNNCGRADFFHAPTVDTWLTQAGRLAQ
jgi:hypothetical protein